MCLSSSSTAADLYKVIDGKLTQLLECENPWNLCTSVGIDNTLVNIAVSGTLPFISVVVPAILYTTLHKRQVKLLHNHVVVMSRNSQLTYFIGLTNQQKGKMSF